MKQLFNCKMSTSHKDEAKATYNLSDIYIMAHDATVVFSLGRGLNTEIPEATCHFIQRTFDEFRDLHHTVSI
jgi:hypothetical protein